MQEYNTEYRFHNFIVFEPASLRINDADILAQGVEVREIFDDVTDTLYRSNTLENLIVQNRLDKIGKMLDLLENYDQLILTRFLDKIWRRYAYISNLGEVFVDLKTYQTVYPELTSKIETIKAMRDDDVSEFETDDTETDDSETSDSLETAKTDA